MYVALVSQEVEMNGKKAHVYNKYGQQCFGSSRSRREKKVDELHWETVQPEFVKIRVKRERKIQSLRDLNACRSRNN